ncbi:unnamed protein product [Gulo gulo]|uniref:Uncharacterized protein n=1 Tax=Gulo gulo TaxID=48420 RepID=A0A9X9LEL8_GULGU|nr:unnamed protein product [Gulo gulo]
MRRTPGSLCRFAGETILCPTPTCALPPHCAHAQACARLPGEAARPGSGRLCGD